MKTTNRKIACLEDKYTLQVLLALLEKGPAPKSIIYQIVSRNIPTVQRRVNALIELGLIHEDMMQTPPFTKTISLTEKGRRVAEKVAEIEEILKEG